MSFTDNSLLDSSILYYDVVITNLNNIDSVPVPAMFTETRTAPFITRPEDYLLSIARFTIDTTTLPVIIPTIKPFSTDKNQTIYNITMSYNGLSFTSNLIFSPQDLQAVIPSPPSATQNGLQDNTGGYYAIYTFQYFIQLVNNTLNACFLGILKLAGIEPTYTIPYMIFDPSTKLASLILPSNFFNPSNISPMVLFFNPALFQLFSSFPFFINDYNSSTGQNIQIIVDNFGQSSEIQVGNPSY